MTLGAVPGRFEDDGFATTHRLLADEACEAIADRLSGMGRRVGTRNLLQSSWCVQLARQLRGDATIAAAIPPDLVAVQCTYFEKTRARNWSVGLHRDLGIPVVERVEHEALRGWSRKEGTWFVQAPLEVLRQLVALRLHVDPCAEEDGPLRVVPGSHRAADADLLARDEPVVADAAVTCPAARGSALLMRPLLLHASSRATGGGRRRVLHFLFGPRQLPLGLRWPITG